MAWTAPRTWVVGEIVTAALLNTHIRDNERYLKGLDGVPTVESGLIIDNTDGDEYLQIPSLTTTERTALTPVNGMIIYNETTNEFNKYENGGWKDLGAGTDHGGLDGLGDDDHTQYQLKSLLTTAGDIIYATGSSTWARLGIGTAGQRLRVNAGATAPEWAVTGQTQQFTAPCFTGGGGALGNTGYQLSAGAQSAGILFRVPADFTALTSAKVIIDPVTTGTFDWTASTEFAADGEAYNTHTDSATADTQAVTNRQLLELDISAAFTGLAAGDNVYLAFTLDVLTTTTRIDVRGLDVKYT